MAQMVDALEFGSEAEHDAQNAALQKPQHKIMLLDNFDSFTYNLKYQLQEFGSVKTWRNDVELGSLVQHALDSDLLVLSPGPGNPAGAGNLIALIQAVAGKVPMFGICLGHQALVEAFGGTISQAPAILHGKTSDMQHDGSGLFENLPKPLTIARYHSLVASVVPESLTVSANVDGQVMAVANEAKKIYGVQFHPESILTTYGQALFENLLDCVGLDR